MLAGCIPKKMAAAASVPIPHQYPQRNFVSTFSENVQTLRRSAEQGHYRSVSPTASTVFHVPRLTVLLLHPPGACSAFTRSGSQYPPLGLNQLKAIIGNPQRVDVLEADGYDMSNEITAETIRRLAPRCIGMTVTCGTKSLTDAWSTLAKNLADGYQPIVIVGGPAANFETISILERCPHVDVVVKGEGEVTFPKIVDILELDLPRQITLAQLSKIPGVCVRDMPHVNDAVIPTVPKDDFRFLPFPDMSSSPVSKYRAPDAQQLPMVTMMTQRGCIAKCTFCNTPQIHGNRIRGWSNEQIIAELQFLKNQHGLVCGRRLYQSTRWSAKAL
jgi:anaerobic magnesium-protoporphyrin IX monomethyl ester cyclase